MPYHNHGLVRGRWGAPSADAKKPVRIAPNGLMVISTCKRNQT